jgi:hypothetical protein
MCKLCEYLVCIAFMCAVCASITGCIHIPTHTLHGTDDGEDLLCNINLQATGKRHESMLHKASWCAHIFCSSRPRLKISRQPPASCPNRAQNARCLDYAYVLHPTQTEHTTTLSYLIQCQVLHHWYSPCMIKKRKSILVLICVCICRYVCVSACICRYVRYVWVCICTASQITNHPVIQFDSAGTVTGSQALAQTQRH